jgi:hypothetical protein
VTRSVQHVSALAVRQPIGTGRIMNSPRAPNYPSALMMMPAQRCGS